MKLERYKGNAKSDNALLQSAGGIRDVHRRLVPATLPKYTLPRKTDWRLLFLFSLIPLFILFYAIYRQGNNPYGVNYNYKSSILYNSGYNYADDVVYAPTPNLSIIDTLKPYNTVVKSTKRKTFSAKATQSPHFSEIEVDNDVTFLLGLEDIKNAVITESFATKSEASDALKRILALGYKNAEIITTDKPFAVAIRDVKINTKSVVQSLKKQGIEAYTTD